MKLENLLSTKLSRWGWVVSFTLILTLTACGGASNDEIARQAIAIIEEQEEKDGNDLSIDNLPLINTNGNTYTGIATGVQDGAKVKYNVTVHYDGENIMAEWKLIEAEEQETSTSSSSSGGTNNDEVSDVAEEGYKAGYEDGFEFGEGLDEDDARLSFSLLYDAPSTPEAKELYKIFWENYKKGFYEGKKAR